MSLKIKNQLGIFDLQNDFSIEIEDTSPIYNERGSQSVPATLPASRNNLSLITHVHRPDSTYSPAPDARVTVSDGVYNRIGKMNITQASKSGGIVSNIGFDESELGMECCFTPFPLCSGYSSRRRNNRSHQPAQFYYE